MKTKLTDTFLKNLKPDTRIRKYFDGGGLFVQVSPVGGKSWRMYYRINGKEKTVCFGEYPAVSLKDARQKRDEAKEQLSKGIDPAAHKKAMKAASKAETENSYEVIAREWHSKFSPTWSEATREKILTRQANDIFPCIGSKPIHQITAPEVLKALRQIEKRGSLDTAHRALQDCSRIFRYAIATGRGERDTAADLRGALAPAKGGHFATITNPKDVGGLLRAIDGYNGGVAVHSALRLAPLVFLRPNELCKAEWAEFDFEGAEWRIPAERMKMKEQHIVPLARQSLAILHELKAHTGDGRFLFPSGRGGDRSVTPEGLLAGLRRLGYDKTEMTIHGFRAMANTLLNEKGYNADWIERQQAHAERNKIRAAYNYAEYLPQRRKMMQEWADFLDELRSAK